MYPVLLLKLQKDLKTESTINFFYLDLFLSSTFPSPEDSGKKLTQTKIKHISSGRGGDIHIAFRTIAQLFRQLFLLWSICDYSWIKGQGQAVCFILLITSSKCQIGRAWVFHLQIHGHNWYKFENSWANVFQIHSNAIRFSNFQFFPFMSLLGFPGTVFCLSSSIIMSGSFDILQ